MIDGGWLVLGRADGDVIDDLGHHEGIQMGDGQIERVVVRLAQDGHIEVVDPVNVDLLRYIE